MSHMKRLAPTAALAAVLTVGLLTSCGSAEISGAPTASDAPAPSSASAEPDPTTSTSTEAPTTATTATTVAEPAPSCAIDNNAAAIGMAAERVSEPGWEFIPTGEGNYNPCQPLSWASARVSGMSTGASPVHILLFVNGRGAGTATPCGLPVTVSEHTDESVTVAYPIMSGPGDMRVLVTYRLVDGGITQEGSIPRQLLEDAGCEA